MENDEIQKETSEEVVREEPVVEKETPVEEVVRPPEVEKKKGNTGIKILIGLIILVVVLALVYVFFFKENGESSSTTTGTDVKNVYSEYRMSGNSLEAFDLYFLQLENLEKNKVYSPLSIKYALEMLAEGASGETKAQLDAVIGDYKAKSYPNSEHMSFANAMFIRNSIKDSIKETYTTNLTTKYGAEVLYDDFASPDAINSWVSNKTFNLVNNLVDDVSQNTFFLINALAIDMNWNNQVHCETSHKIPCLGGNGYFHVEYKHEKLEDDATDSYSAGDYPYSDESSFYGNIYRKHVFNGKENTKGGDILVDYNKYDIIKELGEDKIRELVKPEYEKWLATEGKEEEENGKKYGYETNIEHDADKYLDQFISELKENYGKGFTTTDFLIYDDETVKAFAKDLQEYDGMTLQYVGIMPKTQSLTEYVKDLKVDKVNSVINNLKEVKLESFKEGYATRIRGYIPFFKFEYELDLMKDLQELGITDVFDENKADLSNIKDSKPQFIDKAIHKANIEFSNDGIKASAATAMGGAGAATGPHFEYLFKVPVIDIDISFDKPYMYLIRDKASGEVWFVGTVYEPTMKN